MADKITVDPAVLQELTDFTTVQRDGVRETISYLDSYCRLNDALGLLLYSMERQYREVREDCVEAIQVVADLFGQQVEQLGAYLSEVQEQEQERLDAIDALTNMVREGVTAGLESFAANGGFGQSGMPAGGASGGFGGDGGGGFAGGGGYGGGGYGGGGYGGGGSGLAAAADPGAAQAYAPPAAPVPATPVPDGTGDQQVLNNGTFSVVESGDGDVYVIQAKGDVTIGVPATPGAPADGANSAALAPAVPGGGSQADAPTPDTPTAGPAASTDEASEPRPSIPTEASAPEPKESTNEALAPDAAESPGDAALPDVLEDFDAQLGDITDGVARIERDAQRYAALWEQMAADDPLGRSADELRAAWEHRDSLRTLVEDAERAEAARRLVSASSIATPTAETSPAVLGPLTW